MVVLKGEMTVARITLIYIFQKLGFFDKLALQPAYTFDRIFGYWDKLSRNDYTAFQKEERWNCNSV